MHQQSRMVGQQDIKKFRDLQRHRVMNEFYPFSNEQLREVANQIELYI
jgi:hypothetical protein